MASLDKLRKVRDKLKNMTPQQQEKDLLKILKGLEEQLVAYNTDQLWGGKKADGSNMPNYVPTSKKTGRVRLFETGEFYDEFFVTFDRFPLTFSSKNYKTEFLTARYGTQIFGLTQKSINQFARVHLRAAIEQYYKSLLRV